MKHITKHVTIGLLALALLALSGCTKRYMVLQQLDEPISEDATFVIGQIDDELPIDFDPSDKPSLEEIEKFRAKLSNEITERELGTVVVEPNPAEGNVDYIVEGALLNYRKGNGFVRFFIPALGKAECEMHLRLVNVKTKEIVFAGAFKAMVDSWAESGAKVFDTVSKDFAKEIEKSCEKLEERRDTSQNWNDPVG